MEPRKLKLVNSNIPLLIKVFFALPCLLVGLKMLLFELPGLLFMISYEPGESIRGILLAVLFSFVGTALLFAKSGVTFDAEQKVLYTWWNLLFTLKTAEYSWQDFDWVRVSSRVEGSRKNRRTVYPVEAIGGSHEVTIRKLRESLEARRLAEQVAKFMNLGIKDSTRHTEVVREAGTLDETVRDRILRRGIKLELSPAPAGAKCSLDISNDKACFDIPPSGLGVIHVCSVFVLIIMGVLLAGLFGQPAISMYSQADLRFFAMALVLLGFGIFAVVVFTFVRMTSREFLSPRRLTIDRECLCLATLDRFGNSIETIPLTELEELELRGVDAVSNPRAMGQYLRAVSDTVEIRIGRGLSNEELCWIKDTLDYIISKTPPQVEESHRGPLTTE